MDEYWQEHNVIYFKMAQWRLTRPLLPRRCWLSQKIIWLRPAMRGVRTIIGPARPIREIYWVDSNELMMHKLKYGY
jgi:hypothetical protein